MGNIKVKGIVVELGGDATSLSKAIKSVSSEARDTQSELKKIERLLKMDPGNITLLKQKQELLNQSISSTEEVVTALKKAKEKADQDMASGTEINEKAYRELERQIFANEQALQDVRQEAAEVAGKLNTVDDDELRDVEKSAEKAASALDGAGREAADFGDVLKAGMIAEAAGTIIESLKGVAEETREFRKIMRSLEISSEDAGYTAEQTSQTFRQLYGILADDQSAATATANLQAMHLSQEQLTEMTNAAIGAWSRYGDSINIDSLAEAINHTAQLGEVQSSLADVLEWAGLSVDDFNLSLAECANTSERANLILDMMAKQGLTAAGEKWRENNASMVEANEANAALQEQMALLGEKLEPLMTKLTMMVVTVLDWFNNLDEGSRNFILGTVALVASLGPISAAISGISAVVSGLAGVFSAVMGFIIANPVALLIAGLGMIAAVAISQADAIKSAFHSVIDFLADMIQAVINGINWLVEKINFAFGASYGLSGSFGFTGLPMLASGGTVWSGSAIVGEAGPELLTVSGGKAVVQPLSVNTNRIEGLLGSINDTIGAGTDSTPIVVQVVLDGDKVGETAARYSRKVARANGS